MVKCSFVSPFHWLNKNSPFRQSCVQHGIILTFKSFSNSVRCWHTLEIHDLVILGPLWHLISNITRRVCSQTRYALYSKKYFWELYNLCFHSFTISYNFLVISLCEANEGFNTSNAKQCFLFWSYLFSLVSLSRYHLIVCVKTTLSPNLKTTLHIH